MERIKIDDCNVDEIMNKVLSIISEYDNYDDVKDKLEIIFKTIKNNIEEILIFDDDLYIKLHGLFVGINYDFKNYAMISFYCQSLKFNCYDCGILIDEYSDVCLNLHEINLRNFEKIE